MPEERDLPPALQALMEAVSGRLSGGEYPFGGFDYRWGVEEYEGEHHYEIIAGVVPNVIETEDEGAVSVQPPFSLDLVGLTELFSEVKEFRFAGNSGLMTQIPGTHLYIHGTVHGHDVSMEIFESPFEDAEPAFRVHRDHSIEQLLDVPTVGEVPFGYKIVQHEADEEE